MAFKFCLSKKHSSRFIFCRLWMLLLALGFSQVATASQFMIVWLESGPVINYDLGEEPVITYNDGMLTITTSVSQISYGLEEVLKYTFSDQSTGIVSPEEMIKVKFLRNMVIFYGLSRNTSIQVFAVNGMKVMDNRVTDDVTTISLEELPMGVYIVKADCGTYKIMRQ